MKEMLEIFGQRLKKGCRNFKELDL